MIRIYYRNLIMHIIENKLLLKIKTLLKILYIILYLYIFKTVS